MTNREIEIVKMLRSNIPVEYQRSNFYKIGTIITTKGKLNDMVEKGIIKIGKHPLLSGGLTYMVNDNYKE